MVFNISAFFIIVSEFTGDITGKIPFLHLHLIFLMVSYFSMDLLNPKTNILI